MTTDKFTIYFFGDSIFFGQYAPIHKSWVVQLSSYLDCLYAEKICVGNYSVSGNTSAGALERMAYDIQPKRVDILPVQFGLNDANFWQTDGGAPRVAPGLFKQNLMEIVRRGRSIGCKEVILFTNHPVPAKPPKDYMKIAYDKHVLLYNGLIREAVLESGSTLIDIEREIENAFSCVADRWQLLLPDGIHLSERGHEFYLSVVKPVFKDLLSRYL